MNNKWLPKWVSEIHETAIKNGWTDHGDILEDILDRDPDEPVGYGVTIYLYRKKEEELMLGIESFNEYKWVKVYFQSKGPILFEYSDDLNHGYSISRKIVSEKEFLEEIFNSLK